MKNLIPILLLTAMGSLLSLKSIAQTYSFSTYQEPYESIQAAFPITKQVWDDPTYDIPLGFNFQIFDRVIDRVGANDNLLGGVVGTHLDSLAALIIAFGVDVVDRGFWTGNSASFIAYKVEGQPGNRVYTQEWFNTGFYGGDLDKDSVFIDHIYFQLKLYEINGTIIVHFGPSSITNAEADYEGLPGPGVALINDFDIMFGSQIGETILLSGNPASPVVNNELSENTLVGNIPPNTIYRFDNMLVSSVQSPSPASFHFFFPNPTTGTLHLRESADHQIEFPVRVFNGTGQLVHVLQDQHDMTLEHLPNGLYGLQYRENGRLKADKILLTVN